MRGATPVFADVDLDTQNITKETIERVVTPRTRAIIPVHLGGWPCDMDSIMDLANRHNLSVFEDCAQSHGAYWNGRPVGSFGHAAAFSFCQDKIITTGGEGDMLVLDDKEAWSKAWAFKDHGKSYDTVYNREHGPGFRWLHEGLGTNWRMMELQVAIGRIQLRKLENWSLIRHRNAKILHDRLTSLSSLRIPWPDHQIRHAFYRFYTFVQPENLKPDWPRDKIMITICELGIPCSVGSCSEIYLEKVFTDASLHPKNRLRNAKQLGETSLAFLVHPTLNEEKMRRDADVVYEVIRDATK